jgi:DNA mismatch endonuclease (patch repair protein)
MRRIGSKNTAPEISVRRLVRALGYSCRLNDAKLPGKPDLVFRRRRKAIFVHGCFWHQHTRCKEGRLPASRQGYWRPKLARNVERDGEQRRALRKLGWKTLVIWECELQAETTLKRRLNDFLDSKASLQTSSAS